jgi:integrase
LPYRRIVSAAAVDATVEQFLHLHGLSLADVEVAHRLHAEGKLTESLAPTTRATLGDLLDLYERERLAHLAPESQSRYRKVVLDFVRFVGASCSGGFPPPAGSRSDDPEVRRLEHQGRQTSLNELRPGLIDAFLHARLVRRPGWHHPKPQGDPRKVHRATFDLTYAVLRGLIRLAETTYLDGKRLMPPKPKDWLPDRDGPRPYFTVDQARRLVAHAAVRPSQDGDGRADGRRRSMRYAQRTRIILRFLFGTGARIAEAVRARVADLNFTDREITIRGGKGRGGELRPYTVPLLADLELDLRRWVEADRPDLLRRFRQADEGWLFPALVRPGPVSVESLTKTLRRLFGELRRELATEGADLYFDGWTPHSTRHSYAKWLHEAGCDIVAISRALNHASLDTTQLYLERLLQEYWSEIRRLHPLGAVRRRDLEEASVSWIRSSRRT